jgi:predicted MPP superfamily phosphohydrolase
MMVVGILLLLLACIGHSAIVIYCMNWWYGLPLPRRFIRAVHALMFLVIPMGVGLLLAQLGLDYDLVINHIRKPDLTAGLAWYVATCWMVAAMILPAITLARLLHRPGVLLGNHSRSVDVAARLGYAPIGRGQHRNLARLPGNEIFKVEFAEKTLSLPQLPTEWDGLTILHLSDLHLCGSPDRIFFQETMDLCRDWEPDLVAVTGDYVDTFQHHRWIVPILGRLRWRTAAFAILGNHDGWFDALLIRRRLRRVGMHVLGNSWKLINVRGVPMVVIGQEAPWFTPPPDLSSCPRGVFRLCLSHTPDNIQWARRHQIDLMLSGHVHGGQIRLPIIGSVFVPSRYGRKYDCGTFHEDPTILHVSRGLSGEHPVRYFCRPEATLLTLKRGIGEPGALAPGGTKSPE